MWMWDNVDDTDLITVDEKLRYRCVITLFPRIFLFNFVDFNFLNFIVLNFIFPLKFVTAIKSIIPKKIFPTFYVPDKNSLGAGIFKR